ncbi:amidohydrolase family protein [Neomegalonema sp.]|uniref:amidohydrolase family protein n=1 Tax=Neomegalonema sp. TaxID=2039713 RepID=UPI00260A55FB|nr:amidohydrolase family protein [Neomegalonema sp.]MDD2870162.1 amidohydrolase family protein [Neomegalonema sp.]
MTAPLDLPPGTIDTQMHAYLPGFPPLPGGPGLPAGDLPTPELYRATMRELGISRVVVTQANAHQKDNSCLLACLADFGAISRGVAVIDGTESDAELERLAQAGVVGARIMDLPGGAVGLEHLEAVDARAAELGWMMAVQFDGSQIVGRLPRLEALRSRWVFDHHGKFFSGAAPDGPEVAAVLRLIDRGRMWFKFAGCYESSRLGGPDFADVAALSRVIAAHAPERILWGTNWPHNLARVRGEPLPDDALLAATALDWLPDAAARRRALVGNPQELYGFPAWSGA